jgi:hypothetical protein
MAAIQLTDLTPAGYALLQDSESFLQELSENDMRTVGGKKFQSLVVIGDISIFVATVVTANTNTINANTISNRNTLVG